MEKKPISEIAIQTIEALENTTRILLEAFHTENPDLIKIDSLISEAQQISIELRNLDYILSKGQEFDLEYDNYNKSELSHRFVDAYEEFQIASREFEYKYPTPIKFIAPKKTDAIH